MGEVGIEHFLFLSAALFIVGMLGVLVRRNVLVVFLCIELMVAAANISLAAFAWENNTLDGQIFVLFALAIAAAEAAVGLAIIMALSRHGMSVDVNELRSLRD